MTKLGIPKEIKDHEYRVGVTPAGARVLVDAGHEVTVEKNAGSATGFEDSHYVASGATIAGSPEEVYSCPMVVKVKEPQPSEFPLLREGQVVFTYLHLAPEPIQTKALLDRKVIGIAFEIVTDSKGELPPLKPMSEVAGGCPSLQAPTLCR